MNYKRVIACICLAAMLTSAVAFGASIIIPAPAQTTTTPIETQIQNSVTIPSTNNTGTNGEESQTDEPISTGTDWGNVGQTGGVILAYDSLESMVRGQNLTILANAQSLSALREETKENIDNIEDGIDGMEDAIDGLEDLIDTVEDTLAATMQAIAMVSPEQVGVNSLLGGGLGAMLNMNVGTLESQISSMEDSLEQLEDIDFDEIARQYGMVTDQLVVAAQSTYIGLCSLQESINGLQRSQVVVKSTISEMESRYALGQISEIDMLSVKQSATQLESGILSAQASLADLKGDLSLLLGRSAGSTFSLGALPTVTQEMLSTRSLQSDMATALANNYSLEQAQKELDDARKLKTDGKKNRVSAAEYMLQSTQNSLQNSFQKLYRAIDEQYRLISVAKSDLEFAQRQLAVDQLKYRQGTMTRNELLQSEQTVEECKSAITIAEINLYSSWMQYQWAKKGMMA